MDAIETALPSRGSSVTRRPITVDDYYRMAEFGILRRDERIELIEGAIVAMAPIGGPHVNAVINLTGLLAVGAGNSARVSVRNPVRLDNQNEPEPGIAVLRRTSGQTADDVPRAADVLLPIEVSDSSLDYDLAVKKPLYAGNGIPEHWVVDVAAKSVHVSRDPANGHYASEQRLGTDPDLQPACLPGASIPVRKVFEQT